MNNIAICIPTYKRQDLLRQLLESINRCNVDKTIVGSIQILVVDNDAERTAELVIDDMNKLGHCRHKLHYYNYAVKGLANVRNEMIDRGLELNPDFLVFIDDDEYVTENWINELVTTVINNNADAARGPVFAKQTNSVPESISVLLERENYENNTRLSKWTTGNLIIRRTSLEKFNVRFDKRFNSTGSEDTYFGMQMSKLGATIYWAAHAVTYEVIPAKRTRLMWFIRRAYRSADMYMFILKLEKDYLRIFKKILVSFAYIFSGIIASVLLFFPVKYRYWGILKVSDGIGALAGLLNIHYNEYK
jgi:glycosyltransferase involved in cell wall biosynthesis